MLSHQFNDNGSSSMTINTATGKFEIRIYPNGKKPIIKSYWFYRHARRALERLRKKYGLE